MLVISKSLMIKKIANGITDNFISQSYLQVYAIHFMNRQEGDMGRQSNTTKQKVICQDCLYNFR